MNFQNSNTNKSTAWYLIIIIGLLMFLPMLITWIYVGELNISHNNWMVAVNGKAFGLLKDGTYGFGVNNMGIMCSWQPFIIMLSILIFDVLVWFILVKFNLSKIKYITFIVSTWCLLFSIVVTGLLPYNNKWVIPVRIIIVVISYALSFFLTNTIVNKVVLKSTYAGGVGQDMINDELANKKYFQQNLKPKTKTKEKVKIDDNEI